MVASWSRTCTHTRHTRAHMQQPSNYIFWLIFIAWRQNVALELKRRVLVDPEKILWESKKKKHKSNVFMGNTLTGYTVKQRVFLCCQFLCPVALMWKYFLPPCITGLVYKKKSGMWCNLYFLFPKSVLNVSSYQQELFRHPGCVPDVLFTASLSVMLSKIRT